MKSIILCLIGLIAISFQAKSQFIEDALRYSNSNANISPRYSALGIAYYGISDDASAVFTNPAGLSTIKGSEMSFGFGFNHNPIDNTYLGRTTTEILNNQSITNLAIAGNVQDYKGKHMFSYGLGYFLESDFDSRSTFSGFIQDSKSMISYGISRNDQWVEELGLVDKNTRYSPYTDTSIAKAKFVQDIYQSEKGGLHNFIGAVSFKASDDFSIGLSLIGKWGSYTYTRRFEEQDSLNLYNIINPTSNPNVYGDLHLLTINDILEQNVSGLSGSISFQGRIDDIIKINGKIQLPTYYTIEENFSSKYKAEFDANAETKSYQTESSHNSYELTTPFVYSLGVSSHFWGLTLTGAIEYADQAQLAFKNGPEELNDVNIEITNQLYGTYKYGFGAEYEIPELPIIARIGYQSQSSPNRSYKYNTETLSIGAGVYWGDNVRIDMMYKASTIKDIKYVFGNMIYGTYNSSYTLSPSSVALGITYRKK